MDFSLGLLPYAQLFVEICSLEVTDTDAMLELKAALYFGEGVTEDQWFGLLCVCSEAAFGNERATAMLGDLAYRSFTDDPQRLSRLKAAASVFPGVAMVRRYNEWYVSYFTYGNRAHGWIENEENPTG